MLMAHFNKNPAEILCTRILASFYDIKYMIWTSEHFYETVFIYEYNISASVQTELPPAANVTYLYYNHKV